MKTFISVKNLSYIFVFYFEIYENDLNSLVYKDK